MRRSGTTLDHFGPRWDVCWATGATTCDSLWKMYENVMAKGCKRYGKSMKIPILLFSLSFCAFSDHETPWTGPAAGATADAAAVALEQAHGTSDSCTTM